MSSLGQTNVSDLRVKLDNCRSRLLELLNEWHIMQNVVHPQIMFKYENIFGDIEYKLKEKNIEAQKIEEKINELQLKLNANNNSNQTRNIFDQKKESDIDPVEFSKTYRKIVKNLHPDLNGKSIEFEMYWDNIQSAYRHQDIKRLKMFEVTLCNEESERFNIQEELNIEIKKLDNYILDEEVNLRKLKYQEPFCFEDKLDDRVWVLKRKNILKNKLDQAERKVEFSKRMLVNIASRFKNLQEAQDISELIAS